MTTKKIQAGLVVSFLFYVTLHLLYWYILKIHWWEDAILLYFVPIWCIAIFWVGYQLMGKYLTRKALYYPETLPENFSSQEAKSGWKREKLYISSEIAKVCKYLFGISVPFIFVMQDEHSSISTSTIVKMIICALLTMICYLIEKKNKNKLK